MQTLKHIDVWSAAKVIAVLDFILAVILAVILALFGNSFFAIFGSSTANTTLYKFGWILVALPVIAFVGGLVVVVIEAFLYNLIADRIGGIRIQFKGNELKKVEPLSLAKICGIGGAVFGFIVGLFVLVISLLLPGSIGILAGIFAIVIITVLLAIGGLIGGAIIAVVYTFIASIIGGIQLKIKKKELKSVGVLSYAKIYAVIGLIEGIIGGLTYFFVYHANPAGAPALVATLGVSTIIVYPIIYLVIGFLTAAVNGWLYNRIVGGIGGVKLLIG